MPDFRDIIARRIDELDQIDVDTAAKAEQDRIDALKREAEELIRRDRALKMGMEIVELLKDSGAKTTPVWIQKQVGVAHKPYHRTYKSGNTLSGVDKVPIMNYFRDGNAWELYNIFTGDPYGEYQPAARRRAINYRGQLIDKWSTEGSRHIIKNGAGPQSLPPRGIVDPEYVDHARAIDEIENDENLQLGVASLISRRGIYRGRP